MKKEKEYTEFENVEKDRVASKLSETELKELQEAMYSVNQAQMQIGGVEAHKIDLVSKFSILVKELESTRSILEGKYGSVDIDVNTGEIKDIERDEIDTKN
tara:strand:- start:1458 stop:1760 length:303 start_codon:yes stop_codon:yes gene_type:complete